LKLKLPDLTINKGECSNSVSSWEAKMTPKLKGRLFIPLCRMMPLLVVRPYVKNGVSQLATYFITDGYLEGYGLFYVALDDNHGHTNDVTSSVVAKWSTE
jgi:hypothetical protein